jgi:ubiquitin C-terminal hydrolase
MNSAIQALAGIPSFAQQVFKSTDSSTVVMSAFKWLFEEMSRCTNENSLISTAVLDEFKWKLGLKIPLCRNEEQQDCEEFISALLPRTSPRVFESFRGKLANDIKCSRCAHESSTIEPFVVLNLV